MLKVACGRWKLPRPADLKSLLKGPWIKVKLVCDWCAEVIDGGISAINVRVEAQGCYQRRNAGRQAAGERRKARRDHVAMRFRITAGPLREHSRSKMARLVAARDAAEGRR